MPTLIVSPEAEQALVDIWLYIAKDQPINADRFLERLEGEGVGVESDQVGNHSKIAQCTFLADHTVVDSTPTPVIRPR